MMQQREMVGEGEGEGEAVVACSDKSMKTGASMWDLETGEKLLQIPSCASPPFGIVCLRNRFLAASQVNRHGSVGDGAIAVWTLNKPQQPVLNYTVEAIGALSSTNDGIHLVAGALSSGTAFLWEVTSGKLLKTWMAHNKSLNCMLFSCDNSVLISSSDDGMICVWSMLSLLDVEETRSSPLPLHSFSGHTSSITGLLTAPNSYFSILISSSLDATCKVWDFVKGKHMQTQGYSLAITAIALHQTESVLFCGTEKGTIFVEKLDVGRGKGPFVVAEVQPHELKRHNGAITALASSRSSLISASEDCWICIWDIFRWEMTRRFSLHKAGRVTNLVVVSRSSLLPTSKNKRVSNEYTISPLDKYPPLSNSIRGTTTLHSLGPPNGGNQTSIDSGSSTQKIFDTQKVDLPSVTTLQMRVEADVENRAWATSMAKHVMVINKQLKSHLLDMMQNRLCRPNNTNSRKTSRKKPKI